MSTLTEYAPLPLDRRATLQQTFRRRLRTARTNRQLTQAQAADLLDVCRTTYNAVECGRGGRELTFAQVVNFCVALGVSLDWLIGRKISTPAPTTTSAKPRPIFGEVAK